MTLKNIKYSAIIKLISKRNTEGEFDKSELSYSGNYCIKDGKVYITYDETDGTNNLVKVLENSITIRRTGSFSSVMEYVRNEQTEFNYRTPYGAIPMKIKTHRIVNGLNEDGGKIMFSYTLISGGHASENEISMEIRRDENEKK